MPLLLPYEFGGLIAGLLVPPACLFALAVLTSRRRLNESLAALEGQVARLESPFSTANSELSDFGEMLVLYG